MVRGSWEHDNPANNGKPDETKVSPTLNHTVNHTVVEQVEEALAQAEPANSSQEEPAAHSYYSAPCAGSLE